ncbi:MAG: hypothetical protein WBY53_13750 [Acidobacteriaceae bacterium]
MSESGAVSLSWGGGFLRAADAQGPLTQDNQDWRKAVLSKVPDVAFGFWIIKISATTLGETGGDALSMSLHLGYLVSTAIFFGLLLVLLVAQMKVKRFHAFLYWGVIVGTTLAGTTMADFADRSLGLGYPGGSAILFGLVILSLVVWKLAVGKISFDHIVDPKAEIFYWMTILCSNTLGTALGDWTSEGTGFSGGVFLFLGLIAVVGLLYYFTKINRTFLFWTAFVLTRPFGASMGDLLTKPHADGGFGLSRFVSSGAIALFMVVCILIIPQRTGEHPGQRARG